MSRLLGKSCPALRP
ncbi:hypothetical protein E2C01_097324 [Portunus trituberculatus]|uniref:Uncharacterized protein n=1 Tax=Portunus trituberculatus TaxID=210409 RepID=A0A5B7K9N1_PORTR|nr:hypothetical protein [Portunus trituberculatus]